MCFYDTPRSHMVNRIQALCPGCEKKLAVPQTVAGKRIQCPQCAATVAVPESTANSSEQPSTKPSPKQSARQPGSRTPAVQRQRSDRSTNNQRRSKKQNSSQKKIATDQQEQQLWADLELPSSPSTPRPSLPLPPKQKKRKKESSKPVIVGTGNAPPPMSQRRKLTFRERLFVRGGMIGLVATIGSAVLFFTGLGAGVIFYAAPVVFVLGLIKFANAMFDD